MSKFDEAPLVPDELRKCPYCKQDIETRPFWNHIATVHPEEYENSKITWFPLFKDYKEAGMNIETILMVMPELFNAPAEEIEIFLIHESFTEMTGAGTTQEDAFESLAAEFGKDVAEIKKIVGA